MDKINADVVIIGAGLSGLAAAYHLLDQQDSLKIVVLEAKDRIGGRIKTVQLKSVGDCVDLWDVGGEWVGRAQVHLRTLLRKLNMDNFMRTEAGAITPIPWTTQLDLKFLMWKLKRLKILMEHHQKSNDSATMKQLDEITVENYITEQVWTSGSQSVVDSACRCMFGLAPNEMSLLYFLMYIDSAGGLDKVTKPNEYSGKDYRVKARLQQLATNLVHKIGSVKVLLNQAVTNIVQNSEMVAVITGNRIQLSCRRVILALPPHQITSISFTPTLPPEQLTLLQSVPLGFLVKFAVTYEQEFWDGGNNGHFGFQNVLEDPKLGAVGIVYDATSSNGNPALAGFLSPVKGDQSNDEEYEERILGLLACILGDPARNYIDIAIKDWSKEPFNGGCFLKSLIPGTTNYLNQDLRKPFGRVHFAGTETATAWCGFMNGAVQSGCRAANEVLDNLYPQSKKSKELELGGGARQDINIIKSISIVVFGAGLISVAFLLLKSSRFSPGYTVPSTHIRLLCE
ncbi:probable flavin-containing monoamine oxidase A isoform X2 [Patella vulgata]|uniref:probable flavin-containing monoamine oxidase A isoform X2 n=1 Tax=Patella vulgata TaxID=6465 RepID=UPI00218093FC|nr:probable flavin-containing monoamine oxidase A isoform X2 [Patella vulgata]